MIRNILFFILVTSQVACGQNVNHSKSRQFSFITSILTKPKYNVEILDFVFPNDTQQILLRFQKSIAENKEWYEEYFSNNYIAGKGLPYHINFGITKEEYEKVKDSQKNTPAIQIKSTASLILHNSSEIITFTVDEGDMKAIELVKIDLKNEIILFNKDTVPFYNEINTSATTPLGEWHGYSWKKEISNLGEKDTLKTDSLIAKIIEINFGKIKSSNKVLFRLKYKNVYKGEIRSYLDIAAFLN